MPLLCQKLAVAAFFAVLQEKSAAPCLLWAPATKSGMGTFIGGTKWNKELGTLGGLGRVLSCTEGFSARRTSQEENSPDVKRGSNAR